PQAHLRWAKDSITTILTIHLNLRKGKSMVQEKNQLTTIFSKTIIRGFGLSHQCEFSFVAHPW
ncbi:hypothetical protein PJP10_32520, partial [Mycobacterium kansasii]